MQWPRCVCETGADQRKCPLPPKKTERARAIEAATTTTTVQGEQEKRRGQLHGLPLLIKDTTPVAGLPFVRGCVRVCAGGKDGGVWCLCVLHLPVCMWFEVVPALINKSTTLLCRPTPQLPRLPRRHRPRVAPPGDAPVQTGRHRAGENQHAGGQSLSGFDTCVYVYIYVCVYTCKFVCVYAYVYVCIRVYRYVYVYCRWKWMAATHMRAHVSRP